ncbi:PD-(D/E)XK nuclease family protein [Ilumatobacter sp.]|uniref:PD-(D/E)XK nuclease family protein n=1 Tax=Ilumatobacter sp. TaxID=1967498 RepID=UPI003B52DEF7
MGDADPTTITTPAAGGPDAEELTPVQQRTLAVLRRSGEPLEFDPLFVDEIRAAARDSVDEVSRRLGDDDELWVSKHRIATVLDCEEHHLQPDEFAWSAANATGTIAHKAIELLVSWPTRRGRPTPIDLVDEALARLAADTRGISEWVAALSPADEAEVRSRTTVRVTQFLESFPPLRRNWAPVTEASLRWPVSGSITLAGKVDLQIGRPSGRQSRKVIIDLKTGRPNARHRQDLAFYALLETLVREVPPRKVATFYLDAADAHADDVTEGMLESALRRTIDAIHALVELEIEHRTPVRRPGAGCRWCPIAAGCAEGTAHLAARDADL